MTSDEIMDYFKRERVETQAYIWPQFGEAWSFTAKKNRDGVTLEVSVTAETFKIGAQELYAKWVGIIQNGVKDFAGPLLEAPAKPIRSFGAPKLPDDLPF